MATFPATAKNTQKRNPAPPRTDLRALWLGILFSFLFTGLIWLAGGRLAAIERLPDSGYIWYEWKLPQPDLWARITAWGGYLLHQIGIWVLIYVAQKNKLKYTTGLHAVNYWALGLNALFIVFHFIQTHVWYDALAQDTPIWASQFSVIVLLVAVLLMENNRRGLFFGKKAPISNDVIGFVKRYHGYYFAWAMVYTFWYHPMEGLSQHLLGFLYMFLLMLQGSLFFTRVHVNKWWTTAQEVMVLAHGTLVAVANQNGIWPMFFYGFLGMFVITQMFGLGLKRWQQWAFLAFYAISAIIVYSGRGWDKSYELLSIPLIEFLSVFVLAGLIWLGMWIASRFNRPTPTVAGD